jgi:Fibronectin type III-like domain
MTTSPLKFPLSQDAPNSGAVTVAMGIPSGAEPTGYLLVPIRKGADFTFKRLAGWKRVALAPGESETIAVKVDDRVLKVFDEESNAWSMTTGEYQVLVGSSSDNTPLTASLVVR